MRTRHAHSKKKYEPLQATEEARANINSLAILERHFKTMAVGPLSAVRDTLPGLVGGLHLLWVISRHYQEDAHMAGLLKRISVQLAERVEESIQPRVRDADLRLCYQTLPCFATHVSLPFVHTFFVTPSTVSRNCGNDFPWPLRFLLSRLYRSTSLVVLDRSRRAPHQTLRRDMEKGRIWCAGVVPDA